MLSCSCIPEELKGSARRATLSLDSCQGGGETQEMLFLQRQNRLQPFEKQPVMVE